MKIQTLARRKDNYRYRWYKMYSTSKYIHYNWCPIFHPTKHFVVKRTHSNWGNCNLEGEEAGYCYQTSLVKAYLQKVWLEIKPEIRKELNNEWIKNLFKLTQGNTNTVIDYIKEYYPDFNVEDNPAWMIKFQFTWNSKE